MADDSLVAKTLQKSVKIFCWIMSGKNNFEKARAVNETWVKRCDKYVYVTTKNDSGLPNLDFNIPEGRDHLWAKTKATFSWIYQNELENYDWFLKADDDTYTIMENLRFMLLAYSPEDPLHFGCKFKLFTKKGYMSGGAGYVLSREAVRKFVNESLPYPKLCRQDGQGNEDVEIGKCLENVGVIAGDSRDSDGRHRMLPFSPMIYHEPLKNRADTKWFFGYTSYPFQEGKDCCSDYMVTFHYVTPETMYAIENFLYHIRPIGSVDDLWNQALEKSEKTENLIETLRNISKTISYHDPKK
uniref:N-acetylgalactosaminide beta-1,3-galactosyltransferase n=1 Tax=Panagrolaimus sp. JU765 TaxID=591449 RepID=A0AC34RKR2_9BILA